MPLVGTYSQDRTEITIGSVPVDEYFGPGADGGSIAGASASVTITVAAEDSGALAAAMRTLAALGNNPNRRMLRAFRSRDLARVEWLAAEQARRRGGELFVRGGSDADVADALAHALAHALPASSAVT
jgi:hypothetical protein